MPPESIEPYAGQPRLETFLARHAYLLTDGESRIPYQHRYDDSPSAVREAIQESFRAVYPEGSTPDHEQILLRRGAVDIVADALTEVATQAILDRAARIFAKEAAMNTWLEWHLTTLRPMNEFYSPFRENLADALRPELTEKLRVRPGDRLLATAGGQNLEEVLFGLSEKYSIPYHCFGERRNKGLIVDHGVKSLNDAANVLNANTGYIPWPMAEALYLGKDHALMKLFDGSDAEDSPENFFRERLTGLSTTSLLVCAYTKADGQKESSLSECCILDQATAEGNILSARLTARHRLRSMVQQTRLAEFTAWHTDPTQRSKPVKLSLLMETHFARKSTLYALQKHPAQEGYQVIGSNGDVSKAPDLPSNVFLKIYGVVPREKRKGRDAIYR